MPKKIQSPAITQDTKQLVTLAGGAALLSKWEGGEGDPELIHKNRERISEWMRKPKFPVRSAITEKLNISIIVEVARHFEITIPGHVYHDVSTPVRGVEAFATANDLNAVHASRADVERTLAKVEKELNECKERERK